MGIGTQMVPIPITLALQRESFIPNSSEILESAMDEAFQAISTLSRINNFRLCRSY
jgi:hypothetical protein